MTPVGRKTQSDAELIRLHYERNWQSAGAAARWTKGPTDELPGDFSVLIFPPSKRRFWTYATCCMSQASDDSRVELHLFSPRESFNHVELLTAVAHYHRTGTRLRMGHAVNFGRPWLDNSACDRGLISLPYLDGPALENLETRSGVIRCLWLIPVTASEVQYAGENGLEALESRFEERMFNYLDPKRAPMA